VTPRSDDLPALLGREPDFPRGVPAGSPDPEVTVVRTRHLRWARVPDRPSFWQPVADRGPMLQFERTWAELVERYDVWLVEPEQESEEGAALLPPPAPWYTIASTLTGTWKRGPADVWLKLDRHGRETTYGLTWDQLQQVPGGVTVELAGAATPFSRSEDVETAREEAAGEVAAEVAVSGERAHGAPPYLIPMPARQPDWLRRSGVASPGPEVTQVRSLHQRFRRDLHPVDRWQVVNRNGDLGRLLLTWDTLVSASDLWDDTSTEASPEPATASRRSRLAELFEGPEPLDVYGLLRGLVVSSDSLAGHENGLEHTERAPVYAWAAGIGEPSRRFRVVEVDPVRRDGRLAVELTLVPEPTEKGERG
jgi:hypothetical protein